MDKKLVFLGMGGTIAGTSKSSADTVGYSAGELGVSQLLGGIAGLLGQNSGVKLETEEVARIDSKDMEWGELVQLAERVTHHLERDEVSGIVVTHGTDTLEESAFFLSRVLPASLLKSKAVILTCAMRPFTAEFPDGPQNLRDSVIAALDPLACGLSVVCAGTIHNALTVQKVNTYRLDAFHSGDGGPLGLVEDGRIRWLHRIPSAGWTTHPPACLKTPVTAWPRVELVINAVSVGGAAVRSLCQYSAEDVSPLRGIVVAGTGNGTINKDMDSALLAAQTNGIRIAVSTRCPQGHVISGAATDEWRDAYSGLSAVKARIALTLDLMNLA